MTSELIQKTADFVRLKLQSEHTGHDWYHVERVLKTARFIQSKEGGDLELVELAALLHDLGDDETHDFHQEKGSLILCGMMDILEIEEDLQNKIIKIVNESQWYGDETKAPSTLEGKIIQDADLLDSTGVIGLVRVFATGGNIGRVIYDPKRKPREFVSARDYPLKKYRGTGINQIYEKLLKIPDRLNTETAKKIVKKRTEIVGIFLEKFYKEWNCEDLI